MAKTLFIRLAERADEPSEWCYRSGREDEASPIRSGPLTDVDVAGGEQVVVLVPAAQLVLLQAQVPSKNRTQLLRALPFALEEQFADDVERMHVAAGPADKDGKVAVAAVARDVMSEWLARLADAGIRADALVPDVLALPAAANEWALLHESERVLVRTGRFSGWSTERDNLPILLGAALRQESPETLAVSSVDDSVPQDLPDGLQTRTAQVATPALRLLSQGYVPGDAINLLQGPFQLREPTSGRKRWALVAVLALAVIGLQLGTLLLENHRLSEQALALQQQNESMFQQTFPDVRRVVNPRAQMEQRIEQLRRSSARGDTSAFLDLLERSAPDLSRAGISLVTISYGNRELQVQLTAPDFGSLDSVQKALAERGLEADLGSASAQGTRVTGRLRIRSQAS